MSKGKSRNQNKLIRVL